ncbi:hypothetical protein RND71_041316 [Anisodus tanguticus]|uniref:Uncharacterized protein n=1 Tax=Anisodus tanguticus TaxID=243964 RepID=A0AAE1QTW8_9SOLA|nr:hypothetical protein RND71_041316 [Anisodus tanguticus]
MTDVLSLVQYVTTEAGSLIDFLSHVSEEGELERKINLLHFQLFLKFKFIKAVIRLICPVISSSSTPDHPMSDLLNFVPNNFEVIDSYCSMLKSSEISSSGNQKMDEVMLGFLEYILDDLRKLLHDGTKLISTLSNELKKLTQGVIVLLLTFLADPPIQYIKCKKQNDLLIEIEHITIEFKSAICSLYEDASVIRITEVDHVLFRFQVKLNQVKVENGLIEQLKYEVSMTAPLKDLIVYFQEMLMSLRTFLMDLLEQCKEQHKMTDVLTVVQSVTAEAWSVISSLSLFRLICPDISASSTTDNPITNLLNFLPCNFEVIDTYFNMVKSSERSSSGIPEVDEVFMGFHTYILDNLLLKDGVSLAFTDTDKVKSFYHGLLVLEELFHGKSCPSELEDVGLGIAKSCGGLPLFIVLVAGVLKEKEKKADLWKEVEESLGSHNFGSLEEGMSIIGFSYKNLPNHLKPCFLYFGGFLRGKDVPVSKLSRVWLAEGFLKEGSKEKGSEDAAQEYLKDLIRRNLVMDMEKRSNGKLKTCRIHDLLHQFCVQKAKQDNFLVGIYRDQCGDSTLYSENRKEYRLSIYSKREEFAKWLPSPSGIRSLLFSASSDDSYPTMAHDISFRFDCFKLLKVLDLESINIGDTFPSEIRSLIHMRYFAARTGANSIPSSVADLWNLETFVVKGLRGELKLPRSLWKMFKLRHINVNSRASFSLHNDICESPDNSQLANLETFSTPCLSYGEDAEKILRSMPNLRKMRCIFRGSLDYSKKMGENRVRFPRLDFLNQLESLKLFSDRYPTKHPHEFNFPSKLRELALSRFRLPWTQISTIAKLPNLDILKLLLKAFEGVHWEVGKSDFPELKCLKLENLNIAQWSVSDDDAFPKLESLVITKCKQLENIPTLFEDVVSLKSIEVNWCSWPVANSAQEIQTTQQEDMGNYALTVRIQPPDWSRRYPS